MTFRKVLFWVHLMAGLVSGLSIAIMCITGTVLAFEKELTAWSERDARRVERPAAGAPLPIDELQRRLREAHPEARPTSIVVSSDPSTAVAFSSGRTGGYHVDPYTGEVRQPTSAAMGRFMQTMVEWHRYLGFNGAESRPRGKWINGVCNLAFCLLALTGLILWMPRSWTWRALRPIVWFRQNATGKARDFNWHIAIGFWTAPVLIVLTLTAVPISFRWGGNLIHRLTGTSLPVNGTSGPGGPSAAVPPVELHPVPAGARPLPLDALFASARNVLPDWQTITLRTGGGGGNDRGGPRPAGAAAATPTVRGGEVPARAAGPVVAAPPVTLTVRERASWPRTATKTLMLNPYTGEVLRRSGYADMNAAQRVRAWTRFLHTGEAVGWIGQLIAGVASLGGVFLVYTGCALSWRRFFVKRSAGTRPPVPNETPADLVDVRP
jgi:uncharacterized iron-regulated membrane protein